MSAETKCLLTGATGGIGSAIAETLANAGFSLLLHGRSESKLNQLQQCLPGTHEIVVADLLDVGERTQFFQQLAQRNDISMLINNAGISGFGLFEQQSLAAIEQLMTMNLQLPLQLTQLLLPQIERHQGMVINIGSAFGAIGFPCFSSYCASKFGLRGFSEALARELTGRSVAVGYFAPRTTATSINSPQVNELNTALGNQVDPPEYVAQQLLTFIQKRKRRQALGWPEKFFARLNGMLPELVDGALQKKLAVIHRHLPQSKALKL